MLEEILGFGINLQLAAFVVLGEVEGRDLGDELILTLTLLFLQLEGDTADGSSLNTLHQMGGVSGNLVAKTLGGDDGDLIADTLVGLEVEGETGVVPLDDDLGGLLDGFRANATHFGGICVMW